MHLLLGVQTCVVLLIPVGVLLKECVLVVIKPPQPILYLFFVFKIVICDPEQSIHALRFGSKPNTLLDWEKASSS